MRVAKIYAFINEPIGLWLLSTVAVGLLGFSYDLYQQERELALERLKLSNEIQYRMDFANEKVKLKPMNCEELIAQKKVISSDKEAANQFHNFIVEIFVKEKIDHLFREFSEESTFALVSKFEININRTKFRWVVERSEMPIDDVVNGLALAHRFLQGDQDTVTARTYLFGYTVLTNYFSREHGRHYFKNGPDNKELDCGYRFVGNK